MRRGQDRRTECKPNRRGRNRHVCDARGHLDGFIGGHRQIVPGGRKSCAVPEVDGGTNVVGDIQRDLDPACTHADIAACQRHADPQHVDDPRRMVRINDQVAACIGAAAHDFGCNLGRHMHTQDADEDRDRPEASRSHNAGDRVVASLSGNAIIHLGVRIGDNADITRRRQRAVGRPCDHVGLRIRRHTQTSPGDCTADAHSNRHRGGDGKDMVTIHSRSIDHQIGGRAQIGPHDQRAGRLLMGHADVGPHDADPDRASPGHKPGRRGNRCRPCRRGGGRSAIGFDCDALVQRHDARILHPCLGLATDAVGHIRPGTRQGQRAKKAETGRDTGRDGRSGSRGDTDRVHVHRARGDEGRAVDGSVLKNRVGIADDVVGRQGHTDGRRHANTAYGDRSRDRGTHGHRTRLNILGRSDADHPVSIDDGPRAVAARANDLGRGGAAHNVAGISPRPDKCHGKIGRERESPRSSYCHRLEIDIVQRYDTDRARHIKI